MPNQTPLRILVLHADSRREKKLVEVINREASHEAFAAQLPDRAHSVCDKDIATRKEICKEIKKKVVEYRCHLVILDQALLGDMSNLTLCQDLLEAIAPARCVLLTGARIYAQHAMLAFANQMMLAPATRKSVNRAAFDVAVNHAIKRGEPQIVLKQQGKEPGEWGNSSHGIAERIGVEPEEVNELLVSLFPEAKSVVISPWRRDVSYQSVSRGRSVLFTVSVDGKVEEFLKLAPSDRVKNEAENYRDYVHGWLVGMRHAVLARHKELWNLGGVVYSLVGTGMQIPPTFNELYQSKPDSFMTVFGNLMQSWSWHYERAPGRINPEEEEPLFDQYNRVWSNKLESKLSWCSRHVLPPKGFQFLPLPADWCLTFRPHSRTEGMRKAITHGDLHGENILVDEHENCWVIDFERTGWGPILQDFVELEANIITRLTDSTVEPNEFFRFCVGLVTPKMPPSSLAPERPALGKLLDPYLPLSSSLMKALHAIGPLTQLAGGHTRYMDSRERLWGLLLNAMYIMSLELEPQLRDRAFILGGVICKRLEGWDNHLQAPPWPPAEWVPMLSGTITIQQSQPLLPMLKLQLTDLPNEQHRFKIAVLDQPNQEPHAFSQLPYRSDGLVAVMKLLEPGGYQADKFGTAQVGALEQLGLLEDNRLVFNWCDRIGDHLFKVLVPADGGVRTAFEKVFHTDRKGGELQIIFDEDATDPACQPWEMIHDGFPNKPRTPIDVIRYIASARPAQMLEVPQAPCQILYVTARPNGYTKPDHDRGAIKTSVATSTSPGRFKFNELRDRTHQALKQRLLDTYAPVHVLHFDGHGTFARLCPKCGTPNISHELNCGKVDNSGEKCGVSLANAPACGYLLFETDTGEAEFIDTTKFLEGIQRSEVRLVVLSSCQSARVRGADLLLAGVGPGLILAGVPAVVAMQFSISDQDAIKFNQEFYKALANGDSLPTAVYRARTALDEPACWSPVLYLRSKDHQVHLCPPK